MRIRGSLRSVVARVATATVVLGTVLVGEGAAADGDSDAVPLEQRHLPTVVNAPGRWSDDEDVRGPVAALGLATRTEAVGVQGQRDSLALFAVSAVDGRAAWVRPPGFSLEGGGLTDGVALSPDGRWIGWTNWAQSRRRTPAGRVVGWSVMDTTTGAVRELELSGPGPVNATLAELAFSGDSRHLLTSYEVPGVRRTAPRTGVHQLVAWDVEDGTPTVIEEPGPYWLPNLGSAPSGVTWARGREVFRVVPGADDRTVVTLPERVATASWGPDDTSFAYISSSAGGAWPILYAGRTVSEARGRSVDLPADIVPGQLLGWRDATHVVVGHYRHTVHVVDIVTGEAEAIDMRGYGDQFNAPFLATALWARPLITPVGPDGTTDPRTPWRWLSGAFLVLFVGGLVVWRRRASPTGPRAPAPAQHPPSLPGLATAATGLVVVLVDLDLGFGDVIPDPVGWLMAATTFSALGPIHRGFAVAGVAAWLAVLPSVAEWFGVNGTLLTVPLAAALVLVQVSACTALMGVSPRREPSASAVRWLSLTLSLVLAAAFVAATADPSLGVVVLAVGLAATVVTVWFLVLLYGAAKDGTPEVLSPQPAQGPS